MSNSATDSGSFSSEIQSALFQIADQPSLNSLASATDTRWFHDLANTARIVCFTKGRITFTSPVTDSQAPQRGQAFTYLGDRPDAFAARFKAFGLIARVAS